MWQDANQNGVTDSGELKSLAQLGITSISLVGSGNKGESLSGSAVTNRTTYTTSTGSTGAVAAVDFSTNTLGDIMTAANGGVVIQSTPEGGATPTNSFVAKNATAHAYTLSNGKLTDATTGAVVITSGATGIFSSNQNDTITVTAGDTTPYWLGGGTGADTLTGGAGNTVFLINAKTIVHGGTGFNIAEVTDGNPITVDLKTANLQEVIGGAGDGVFNASGTTWNVFIQGGSGNNIIIGGKAHDALSGGKGDDLIEAGSGGSVIHAGSGNDVIYGGSGSGNDPSSGKPYSDVVYGGPGNDIVMLGTNNSVVYAGSGTMTLIGNSNKTVPGLGSQAAFSVLALHGSYADYTLTRNASGTYTITDSVAGRDGAVTFSNISALDFSDVAQVSIATALAMPVNDSLNTGNASQVTTNSSGQYVVSAATLLANDKDYAGKTLSIRELLDNNGNAIARGGAAGQVNGGTAALSADGSTITFTPAAGYTGVMSFRYHVQDSSGAKGMVVNQIGTTQTAEMTGTVYLNTPNTPTDPLFDKEWFLQAANVIPVLSEYTGKGVKVGVFDVSGNVDFSNPDLAPNAGGSVKINGAPGIEQIGAHATLVAGVIGAAMNGQGAVGVAPGATLSSEAVGPAGSSATSAENFNNLLHWSNYDVVNNSFGLSPPFFNLALSAGGTSSELDALQNAITNGRGGLGTIVVVAGGNDRALGLNTNDFTLTNSPYEITVGGINAKTDLAALQISGAPFSDAGYSILVSAPANNITSDGVSYTNEYGQQFGASVQTAQGTSFATPIVSGVVADMLQANPKLTWQDVQDILAYSAVKVDPADTNPFVAGSAAGTGWTFNGASNWNGGGLHYSPDYGFGEVDALAAVRLAETWQTIGTGTTQFYDVARTASNLASGPFSQTFTNSSGAVSLEHVQVIVNISNAIRSDLTITLTSPSGVTSTLMARPGYAMGLTADAKQFGTGEANDFTPATFDYTFETVANWGETWAGSWTVKIADAKGVASRAVVTGTEVLFEGVPASSSSQGQTYIYTDEFALLSDTAGSALYNSKNAARSVLWGTGFSDTLDAAATTGALVLDLNAGTNDSTIDGRFLSIAPGSKIDTVMLGGGSATVYGNNDNDTFYSGAGSALIYGGSGADTYVIGHGQATIVNGVAANAGPSGVLKDALGGAGTLWFTRSGNDLVIQTLGSTTSDTIKTWFANSYSQLLSVTTQDGATIGTSQITALANAMTAYQTANPGFNPATATALPSVPALTTGWAWTVTGVGQTINATGDAITLGVGASATINGTADTINLSGAGSSATVNGANTINLAASNETVALGTSTGDKINIAASLTNETVSGSSAAISVGANGGINLTGNSDVVTAASGSSVVITGASDKIVASNSTIIVNAGSAVTINGSNDTIVMNGSSTVTSGTGSSGDTFVFRANFGHDTIYEFNASDYVQIDKSLFPDWAHLQAAIKPAGTTDAIIAYDANNTIAFNHVLPAQLNSGEFRFV